MNWKKTIISHYAQIIFVFSAFFLMIVIGGFFIGSVIRAQSFTTATVALEETEKTIRAYLREPKIAFDNIYAAVTDMLDRGESREAVLRYLKQTSNMLLKQENGIKGFTSVYGFIRGKFLSGVEAGLGDDYIPQQRPWYQLAIRSEGAEYTAPYLDAKTGLMVLSLTKQIYGERDEYYGVMALDIDISWLTEYAESLRFADGGYGMIVNQHLYTLAHPVKEYRNISLQELGDGYARISDMMRTNKDVSAVNIRDTNGTRAIVFFKRLYNGWHVGVVMPVHSYYSELYTAILVLVVLGIALATILSCILLRRSGEKMRADEENSAKSSFLAHMSHEIRTPMNAIMGIAQIQLQKGGLPDEQETALKMIYSSGNTLLGIINDILDISKIEAGKMELNPINYDLPSLINDSVQLNIVRIGSKPIEFILDMDKNLPSRMYGDELRLKQILNNLLSNAIKYTEKGHVKLSVDHLTQGGDVNLRFMVEDTGQGLKPEDREKLFSEYLRFNAETNRTTEGTGIGLNIAKSLIKMMEGEIKVESEYGQGSVFTVTVRQKAVECEAIGEELSERLRGFTFSGESRLARPQVFREPMPYGQVLIVDDVETNLYVAEGLMSPYGLKIETAASGFAALEKVQAGKTYDVIFMDHMMPLMDGLETTKKIRMAGYGGAIVALTANALTGNKEMFRHNGFDGFMAKPIDIRQLNEMLNKLVRDRHPDQAEEYKSKQAEPAQAQSTGISPKLFQIFCRDAQKAVVALREGMASGNMKMFAGTAHAMKSALANIGEAEKSKAALALEEAGLKADGAYIAGHAESFIEALEGLIKNLVLSEDAAGDGAAQEDTAYLQEQLRLLESACESYNDAAAYAALDRLKEKSYRPRTVATLDELRDMLFLHSDFEGAAERARLICADVL